MLLPLAASAAAVEIRGLYYNLDSTTKTAEVTSNPYSSIYLYYRYSGDVVIPETVTYMGTEYVVTSISSTAFYGCSDLTSVNIPNSVTFISNNAFESCSGLTSVNIPNGVTSINSYTFFGCSSLTSVTIPDSVTVIGAGAFWNCIGLTSITIPDSVISINDNAFYNCNGLTSVTIGNSVTSIGISAFEECWRLTSVTIPNGVTSIEKRAFYHCTGLTSITIPNSVTSIGSNVFSGCSGLTSVTIGNSVTSIGSYAFCECSSLTSVIIPNSVTTIDEWAFSSCRSLISVIIGSGVQTIKSSAFAYCSKLTDVYCHAEIVPSTKADAFTDSYIEYSTLHVPAASVEAYKKMDPWSGFKSIVAWDGTIPELHKCATPTISYENGRLTFDCETDDVEFVYNVAPAPGVSGKGNDVELKPMFTVSVYATKDGFVDSEVATMEITVEGGSGLKGDVNGDGEVGIGDIISITNIMSIRP